MFRLDKIETTTFYIIVSLFLVLFVSIERKYDFHIHPIKVYLSKLPDKERLIELKIVELNSQIATLKQENEYLNKYKTTYTNLKKIHNVKSLVEVKYISNSVNGRYLTAQTEKTVKRNDLVVDDKNILIGRIVGVNDENNVKIQLLSDIYSNIPVYVNDCYGIIYGTNDKNCKIAFQNLSTTEPKDGDLVITSGFENLTIRGVVAGAVINSNGTWCVDNKNIDYIDKLAVIGD